MIVYAREDGTVIWSSVRANHKQGRVPAGTGLGVVSTTGDWHELYPVSTKAILAVEDPLRDKDYGLYPNFWVKKADCVEELQIDPVPEPEPEMSEEITDDEAAYALFVLKKWWTQ